MSRAVRTRALLALGLVAALGATRTAAYWSDSRTVPDQSLTLGHLDLVVDGDDPDTAFTQLTTPSLQPGGSTAGVMTVKNAGTLPLSYWAEWQASDPGGMRGSLTAKVTGASSTGGSGTALTCPGSALANSATSISTSATAFLGTNAARRTLAAGASETVCVQVSMSSTAPGTLQGATAPVTITFHAKQLGAP